MTEDEYIPTRSRERRLARPRKGGADKSPVATRKPRTQKTELRRQIERVLNGDSSGTPLGRAVGHIVRRCDARQRSAAREMLLAFERDSALLISSPEATAGVILIARFRDQFLRTPLQFTASGSTPQEQLRRLANHLFEEWAVPQWLDEAWLHDVEAEQKWFVHLGSGKNLSTAADLPFALTRRMAHFAVNAPRGLNALQALRWGQCRGLEIPEELCQELINTRLSTTLPDEPFWKTILMWFSVHPEIFGHATTIVDYAFAQRIGDFAPAQEARWSIRGRTPDRLLADARAWHAELNRRNRRFRDAPPTWKSCGISGLMPKADAGQNSRASGPDGLPKWSIMELLSQEQLELEGRRLHHCVASYAPLAAFGRSAIFSLRRRVDDREISVATIEVRPAEKQIVQARSLQNAAPADADQRLIEHWAKSVGLGIAPHVFKAPARRR